MFKVTSNTTETADLQSRDGVSLLEALESIEIEEAEMLQEAGAPRKQKKSVIIKRAAGRRSILLAKASSDVLYTKYRDTFERLLNIKGQIMSKYGRVALKQAQKSMRK